MLLEPILSEARSARTYRFSLTREESNHAHL